MITSITFLVSPAVLTQVSQAQSAGPAHRRHELRYRVIDLGTFGGHNSFTNGGSVVINGRGVVVGQAESAEPCPYIPDGVIAPPFEWQAGVMTELPRLPGGCGGFPSQ